MLVFMEKKSFFAIFKKNFLTFAGPRGTETIFKFTCKQAHNWLFLT